MKLRLACAAVALLFAAACGARATAPTAPPASTSTATPAATPGAIVPATPASGASLTLSPGVIPPNLAFPFTPDLPIPAVVREVVLGAASSDIDALVALAKPQQVGCTTAQGAGGPPKCKPGDPAGTVYEMFPTGACEGEWAADTRAALTALIEQPTLLYAAAEVEAPSPDAEPYWPKGQYAVVFTANGANSTGIYFVLDSTNIVRAHAICEAGAGAATNLLRQLGTVSFLIPPGR